MKSLLIAGCGDLGIALGEIAARDGAAVHGLRRDPSQLPAAIRPLAADLTDRATLAALPAADAVVYAAAAGRSDEVAYRTTYVDGVTNLLDALASAGHVPRRFVFVSSTAPYEATDGRWVDETTPVAPAHWSGRALVDAEARVLEAAPGAVVLRLGGIYGPGRTRLVDDVVAGRARWSPGPPRYGNRIHRDDAAAAVVHLLRLAAPEGLYLGVDHEPADLRLVLEWLAAALGAPPPRPSDAAVPPSGPRARSNKRCRNERLVASGFRFRYPTFREGYAPLVAARVGG